MAFVTRLLGVICAQQTQLILCCASSPTCSGVRPDEAPREIGSGEVQRLDARHTESDATAGRAIIHPSRRSTLPQYGQVLE